MENVAKTGPVALSTDGDSSSALTRFIARTGARCVGCNYDLKGIDATRCPECGAELQLNVLMAADATFRKRPRRVAWSVGAVWLGFVGLAVVIWGHGGSPLREIGEVALAALAVPIISAALLGIDRAIFNDRIRDARARTVPTFGIAVNVWCVLLLLAAVAEVAWMAWKLM